MISLTEPQWTMWWQLVILLLMMTWIQKTKLPESNKRKDQWFYIWICCYVSATYGHEKKARKEGFYLSFGLKLFLYGLFSFSSPPTNHYPYMILSPKSLFFFIMNLMLPSNSCYGVDCFIRMPVLQHETALSWGRHQVYYLFALLLDTWARRSLITP